MRSISQQGLELIKRYEGFSPKRYICPAGKPTIGYGHVMAENEDIPEEISHEEANKLLLRDVAVAENTVNRLIDADLTQSQFDALVSFTFNLGAAALARSTLRKRLNEGDFKAAASEFPRWVYAGGKVLDGLVKRRFAEAELFLG